jgi:hypothetical protein
VKPKDVDRITVWDCKNRQGFWSLHSICFVYHRDVILLKLRKLTCLSSKCMDDNVNFCENKTHVEPWILTMDVATLTWPSVGVKPNTWKSWGFGVLRDSRMFRARQQGAKHLALRCSWCHWKGLETKISKMASHWSFGHLQPKLWAKEGPRIKLAIWLPTTKSRESMPSRGPIQVCNMELERSRRGLQLWFRPHRDPTL